MPVLTRFRDCLNSDWARLTSAFTFFPVLAVMNAMRHVAHRAERSTGPRLANRPMLPIEGSAGSFCIRSHLLIVKMHGLCSWLM